MAKRKAIQKRRAGKIGVGIGKINRALYVEDHADAWKMVRSWLDENEE